MYHQRKIRNLSQAAQRLLREQSGGNHTPTTPAPAPRPPQPAPAPKPQRPRIDRDAIPDTFDLPPGVQVTLTACSCSPCKAREAKGREPDWLYYVFADRQGVRLTLFYGIANSEQEAKALVAKSLHDRRHTLGEEIACLLRRHRREQERRAVVGR